MLPSEPRGHEQTGARGCRPPSQHRHRAGAEPVGPRAGTDFSRLLVGTRARASGSLRAIMGGHRLARAAPIAWPRSRRVAFSFRGLSPTGVRVGGAPKQEECGPVAEGRRRSAEWGRRPRACAPRAQPDGVALPLYVACARSGRRLGGSVRSVKAALLVK